MPISYDFGGLAWGIFSFFAHLVLLLVSLVCGCIALFLLLRRRPQLDEGYRLACTALGISALVEVWCLFLLPLSRYPNSAPWRLAPLPTLFLGLLGLTVWSYRQGRARHEEPSAASSGAVP